MSCEYRLPLPEKLGLGMSATIPNFGAPKSKKFGSEELAKISDRLFSHLQDESAKTTKVESKKKTKHQILEERRLMTSLFPNTSDKSARQVLKFISLISDMKQNRQYF